MEDCPGIYTRELRPIFTDIPFDCMNIIFEFFDDYKQLARCSQVCWWTWELAQEENLWKTHCCRCLPATTYHNHAGGSGAYRYATWQSLLRKCTIGTKAKAITAFVQQAMGSPHDANLKTSQNAELKKCSALVFATDGVCIGSQGAKVLATILQTSSRLSTLDLSRQLIRDAGLIDLAQALSGCPQLQSLVLVENQIKDTGVEVLCAAVAQLVFLHSIDLRKNGITAAAAPALSTLVRSSSCLTDLYLSENHLQDQGALLILQAVVERVTRWKVSTLSSTGGVAKRQWYLPVSVLELCSVGLSSNSWKSVLQKSQIQSVWEKASFAIALHQQQTGAANQPNFEVRKKMGPSFLLDLRTLWLHEGKPGGTNMSVDSVLTPLQAKLANKIYSPDTVPVPVSPGAMCMTVYLDSKPMKDSGCTMQ